MGAWLTGTIVCSFGLALTLVGEFRGRTVTTALGKLVAASAYLGVALALGAGQSAYGRAMLAGMVCCWAGDLLLVAQRNRGLFVSGLLAFLFGHLAYSTAFVSRGQAIGGWLPALPVMLGFAALVLRWLGPHLDRRMRAPVYLYVAAISAMMVFAAGTHAFERELPLLAGAFLFLLSDLAVARNRFVAPGFINRALGLPVYFLAQLLLAATIAN
jgi:uncharacterized membrane protein YhhN